MRLMWGDWVNCDLIRLFDLKKLIGQTNSVNYIIITRGCACIQPNRIFRAGVVQIYQTGMNKLGDSKGLFGLPGFGCTSVYSADPHIIKHVCI